MLNRILKLSCGLLLFFSATANADSKCESFYLFDPMLAAQKQILKEQLKMSLEDNTVLDHDQAKIDVENVFKNLVRAFNDVQNNVEVSVQSAVAILKLKSGMRDAESFLQNFESLNRPSIKGGDQTIKVDVFNARLKTINDAILNLNPKATPWWKKPFSTEQAKEYDSIKLISEQIDGINRDIKQFEENEVHLLKDAIDMVDLLKRNKKSEVSIVKFYDALSELYTLIENSGSAIPDALKTRMLSQITNEMTLIQTYTRLIQTSHQNLEKNLNAALSTLEIIEVQKTIDLTGTLLSKGMTPSIATKKIEAFERIIALKNARAEKFAAFKKRFGKRIIVSCIGACVLTGGGVAFHLEDKNSTLDHQQKLSKIVSIRDRVPESDFHVTIQNKYADVIDTKLLETFKVIDSKSAKKWTELWLEMMRSGKHNTSANRLYMYSLTPKILKHTELDYSYEIGGKIVRTNTEFDYSNDRFASVVTSLQVAGRGGNGDSALTDSGVYLPEMTQAIKAFEGAAAALYGTERVTGISRNLIDRENTFRNHLPRAFLNKAELDGKTEIQPQLNSIFSAASGDRTAIANKDQLQVLSSIKAHENLRISKYYKVNATEMSKVVFAHTEKTKLQNDDVIYLLSSNIWSTEQSETRPTFKLANELYANVDQALNTNYASRDELKYIDLKWVLANRIVDSFTPVKMGALEASLMEEMLNTNLSAGNKLEADVKKFIMAKFKAKINPQIINN